MNNELIRIIWIWMAAALSIQRWKNVFHLFSLLPEFQINSTDRISNFIASSDPFTQNFSKIFNK